MLHHRLRDRAFLAVAALLLAIPAQADATRSIGTLDYLSTTVFPTGTRFGGQLIGGLSGIDYDARSGTFITQRDNAFVGAAPNGDPRPVAFTMAAVDNGTAGFGLQFTGVRQLGAVPLNQLESIRFDPAGDGVWLTSEQPHGAYHVDASGRTTQLALDPSVNGGFTPSTGNAGLEGMSFTPGGALWVGREASLAGDPVDIVRLSQIGRDGALQRQFAYRVDTLAAPQRPGTIIRTGLSEILGVADDHLLVMERGWDGTNAAAAPTGVSHNVVRVYEVDLADATQIVPGAPLSPAAKRLVFDSSSLDAVLNSYDTKIDNLEGMSFGPTLADGRRSLVMVSDNNNSASQRKTQLLVFGISPVPEPASWAMMLVGFGMVAAAGRRRRTCRVPVATS